MRMFFTAAAERKEMYRFSVDLGKLALRIADKYGGSAEKWFVIARATLDMLGDIFLKSCPASVHCDGKHEAELVNFDAYCRRFRVMKTLTFALIFLVASSSSSMAFQPGIGSHF